VTAASTGLGAPEVLVDPAAVEAIVADYRELAEKEMLL